MEIRNFSEQRLQNLREALIEYNVDLDAIFPYPYNGNDSKPWKDTFMFSEAANTFRRTGKYTHFLEGTPENDKFWDEEEKRIENGYQHPVYKDQWISGWHYLYLNYCPIYHKSKKKLDFPDFWDLDADYFKRLDIARTGIEYKNFSEEEIIEHLIKHFLAVKSRQKGFSLKDVVPLVYMLNFRPYSISYLGSFLKTHATKSWTFLKNYLSHINKHTIWYKDRNPDTKDYMKAAYKQKDLETGREHEMGYLSEIFKLCFEDEPSKGVGGALDIFIYEEAGVSPTLKETIDYVLPNVTEGDITSGFIIAYGSVGDMDKCKDLQTYYYKPDEYGFYGIENVWGSGGITGYFVPEYLCMHPHIDKNGNSNVITALESIIKKRDVERKKSTADYNFYCSQHPISDHEAFLSRKGNMYPLVEIKKHMTKLIKDPVHKNYGFPVELIDIGGGEVKYLILNKEINKRYDEYPIENGSNNIGVTWIFELPDERNYEYLYISSADTVDQGDAKSSNSIQSIFVYKMDTGNSDQVIKNEIIASYSGRTENPETWYENALLLLRFYNCKCLVENHNVGFINYVKSKGFANLLENELAEIKALNPTSTVSRGKGYHPTTAVQINGDKLILKELIEVRKYLYNEQGEIVRKVLGLEYIKDVGLLEEVISYDGEKNADRFTAFRGLMLYKDALLSKKLLPSEVNMADKLAEFANKLMPKTKKSLFKFNNPLKF